MEDIVVSPEKNESYLDIPQDFHTCNRVLEHFSKALVYGATSNPENMYVSSFKDPTYFPSYHYLSFENELQEGIVSAVPFMNILVVQTKSKTYGLKGNTALDEVLFTLSENSQFKKFNINLTVGCIAPKSVRPVRNRLYFLSGEGLISLKSLYAVDEQYNIEHIDYNINNIVPRDVDAVAIQHDNQYWIDFPTSGFTLRYYIDKQAWVKDVYEITDFQGVFKYIIDTGVLRIITNRSNGYIYEALVDKSLPYDFGTPCLTRIIPAFLDQNYPFHPKNYKELKIDLTLQNEYNQDQGAIEKTFVSNGAQYATFEAPLLSGHTYRFEFDLSSSPSGSISISGYASGELLGTIPLTNDMTTFDVLVPYHEEEFVTVTYSFGAVGADTLAIYESTVIYDVTYDSQVNFDVWATTEKVVLATPESTVIEIIDGEAQEVYTKEENRKNNPRDVIFKMIDKQKAALSGRFNNKKEGQGNE